MKVQIEGNIYLESDALQFILKEYTGATTVGPEGKEREIFKTIGYFTGIEYALKHFLKLKIMASTASTLRELLQEVREIRQYIETICEGSKDESN
ncbi:hypothetical protein [Paenibacillus sp. GCM10027626]|uniref:hypothetical protein n=1 Tax=Paenibacillus sp. GCM10027626 TaxID=3273411 RepID=UPI003632F5C0